MEGTITESQPPNKPSPWSKPAAWGKPQTTVTPCSLEDVMSEQLATELQQKEDSVLAHEDKR